MDFNMHMRNTAYLDRAVDIRMMFFTDSGFAVTEFAERKIGPVIMRDEAEYFREIRLLDEFHGSLEAAGSSEDGSRFRLRNEFTRTDGQLAARITSTGGWLDLAARKLIAPPADLLAVMSRLSRTQDFEVLPSSRK
jgi:acyl-CoA thioester hydrolase